MTANKLDETVFKVILFLIVAAFFLVPILQFIATGQFKWLVLIITLPHVIAFFAGAVCLGVGIFIPLLLPVFILEDTLSADHWANSRIVSTVAVLINGGYFIWSWWFVATNFDVPLLQTAPIMNL
jgi:hypothetical protein